MHEREGWSVAKEVSRLLAVAVIVSTVVGSVVPWTAAPVAQAGVLAGKNDDKDKKEKNEKKNKDDDRGDDFVLNGQVLAIDERKDPPEMVVGTVDGEATVRVLKTDEIAMNGVHVGDYVELTGEKVNELLFEATEISVGERFTSTDTPSGASSGDSEDDDSDDEDDGE
jgi:hypothetical protein